MSWEMHVLGILYFQFYMEITSIGRRSRSLAAFVCFIYTCIHMCHSAGVVVRRQFVQLDLLLPREMESRDEAQVVGRDFPLFFLNIYLLRGQGYAKEPVQMSEGDLG